MKRGRVSRAPRSARGGRAGARARRSFPHGFTLVEMLVVLVIVGTLLALVSLKIVPDERASLREETRRLAILFEQARDEALTTGRSIVWSADTASYGFWQKDQNQQWAQTANDEVFRSRALAPPVNIVNLQIRQVSVPLNYGLVFSPSGLNAPFRLELAVSDHRATILGSAAGRVTLKDEP